MTQANQFSLLKTKRFLPLFVTQFLGAFHDNVFKNALVVLLLFGTGADGGKAAELLTTLAAGVFILPYVLFSGIGGDLADKFPKHVVLRTIKVAELGIAILGAGSLLIGSIPLCFLTLFCLGSHSAFFSPGKYSILPHHLETHELIGGNALINVGTFAAILLGTVAGTMLIALPDGAAIVSGLIGAVAVLGYLTSRHIPHTIAINPDAKISRNIFAGTARIVKFAMTRRRDIRLAVLGISWFYFMGGMFMAQLPNFVHDALGGDEKMLLGVLMLFSVGVAAGGLINDKLLRGRIEAVYVPLAVLGISIFSVDLYLANPVSDGTLPLRIGFDIFMIAVCGGMFDVPLNAMLQERTTTEERSRVMAGNAAVNALFIVASSVFAAILIAFGLSVRELFFVFAGLNAVVAIYICKILPDYLFKSALQALFKIIYRVEVRGFENFEKAGKRAVIVGNHVSLLDPPLLAAFLPGKPMFAINSFVAEWWWVKPFLKLVDAFPLNPTSPFSLKSLIREVEKDRHAVIFPEGRLTETGALMKIYDGPGMIADKADAMIIPVRLDGVQHTPFARLKGKVPLHSFPKITITILEPRKLDLDPALKGRARRAAAGKKLYDVMEEMMFLTGDREQTLFEALLKAKEVNGDNSIILEDVERKPMKFKTLIRGALVLGKKLEKSTEKGEAVGVMLPNSIGAVTAFFALQAFGRVPAMLNYSTGAKAMLSACRTAKIKTIVTSRRFVEAGRLGDLVTQLSQIATVVYLEDLKNKITKADKIYGALAAPRFVHRRRRVWAHDPAVILFTSGSEGEPKGVVLSHANLMTNIVQLTSRADFNRQDIVFNALPMFHSFGLTGGTLLPVLSGVKTFLYPSPLHYRIVPEMVYSSNATIMFGTDTFLQGYARSADPYDFYRMRYIFAGAEKVKDETRHVYMERFGVQVLEGYGATETAPVIAVNSAMHNRNGTVGRFLSGIEWRLEKVEGVSEGGRLYVRGANVMLGYYLSDNPAVLAPPEQGWHDTGDIVSVDADGFVKILGRAKRFAKIAGEMVSLTLSESIASAVWTGEQHAVISIPDPRKGEQLVLLTTQDSASREALSAYAAQHGITALAVPALIITVAKMPVLGSGKTDYPAVKAIIAERLAKAA